MHVYVMLMDRSMKQHKLGCMEVLAPAYMLVCSCTVLNSIPIVLCRLNSHSQAACSTRWCAHIPQQAMEGDGMQGPCSKGWRYLNDQKATSFSQNAKAAQIPTSSSITIITKFVSSIRSMTIILL